MFTVYGISSTWMICTAERQKHEHATLQGFNFLSRPSSPAQLLTASGPARASWSRASHEQGSSEPKGYCAYPSGDVARAAPRTYLCLDPFLQLPRQHLALEQLHEQNHALVRAARDALPDGEAVDDGVRRVRRWGREAVFDHVVYLS